MSEKIKILFTGATGYIGGAILDKFLARPDASSFDIRAVVRSPQKGEKLKALGITPLIGSHDDEQLMVKAASEVDVVFANADCDDLHAAKITLKGVRKRFEETGKPPIYINTSGTGTLLDNAGGMYNSDKVWSDADPDDIETLPPTQVHRNVDLELVAADKEGYVNVYIVLPSAIFSLAKGPCFDKRISNPQPIIVTALLKAALDRKQVGVLGKGVNIWPNVDILEMADLYNVLWDAIMKNPEGTPHGREGYYFVTHDEFTMYDLGKAIAEASVELGILTSSEVTPFTEEESRKYLGYPGGPNGWLPLGGNGRCRADRAKSLGWKPKKTTQDMVDSVKECVEVWLRENTK